MVDLVPSARRPGFAWRWVSAVFTHPHPAIEGVGWLTTVVGAVLWALGEAEVIPVEAVGHWGGLISFIALAAIILSRLILAPGWVFDEQEGEIKRLQTRIDTYEAGPSFVIEVFNPAIGLGEGPSLVDPTKTFVHTAITVQVQVTNRGAPGAALHWAASLVLPDKTKHTFTDFPFHMDYRATGSSQGDIPRNQSLSERTARSMERNETEWGWYVGFLPETVFSQVVPGTTLVFRCEDNRGVESVGTMVLERRYETPGIMMAPTLSRMTVRPNLPPDMKDS